MANPPENLTEPDQPLFIPIPSGFKYRPANEFFEEQRSADPVGYDRDLAVLSEQVAAVDRYHSPFAVAARLAILNREVRW